MHNDMRFISSRCFKKGRTECTRSRVQLTAGVTQQERWDQSCRQAGRVKNTETIASCEVRPTAD